MTYRVADGAKVSMGREGVIASGAVLTEEQVARFGAEGMADLIRGRAVVEVTEQKPTKGAKPAEEVAPV